MGEEARKDMADIHLWLIKFLRKRFQINFSGNLFLVEREAKRPGMSQTNIQRDSHLALPSPAGSCIVMYGHHGSQDSQYSHGEG